MYVLLFVNWNGFASSSLIPALEALLSGLLSNGGLAPYGLGGGPNLDKASSFAAFCSGSNGCGLGDGANSSVEAPETSALTGAVLTSLTLFLGGILGGGDGDGCFDTFAKDFTGVPDSLGG